MKKILFPLFFVSTLALAGCEGDIVSVRDTKNTLEESGYTVETYGGKEAEERFDSIRYVVDIKDALFGYTMSDNGIVAFYCHSSKDAGKLFDANSEALVDLAKQFTTSPHVGTYNNVTFAGSDAAVRTAGFVLEF